MSTAFHVIIPARFHSTRLPGKLLKELGGQTILERVYQQALLACPRSITIATDHEDLAAVARRQGAAVFMSNLPHQSGTERIAEVVARGNFHRDDIIVNVQGDEPFIHPELITQVARLLGESSAPMASLCWPIDNHEDFNNPNVVKVVLNDRNQALYFSRAAIPVHRDDSSSLVGAYRHIGLYAYRVGFLLDYVSWPSCDLERFEQLEQLRVLFAGYSVQLGIACRQPMQDINTAEDLANAEAMLV